jgi:hypothetical protein
MCSKVEGAAGHVKTGCIYRPPLVAFARTVPDAATVLAADDFRGAVLIAVGGELIHLAWI